MVQLDGSPRTPTQERDHYSQKTRNQQRLCDYCNDSTALLYCRADSAKLCFSCDRNVHSANQLFNKHTRSQLCDICGNSPSSIFCSTESYVLCQNCDWEKHNFSLSSVHERRPLEGFSGCPSVTELLTIVGFENVDEKALILSAESGKDGGYGFNGLLSSADGFSDFLVWDTPSFISLDDLIVTNSDHNLQAMGVPPLPKNRNAACGQHKEEILGQLRKLAKVEYNLDSENLGNFEAVVPEGNLHPGDTHLGFKCDAEPTSYLAYEACYSHWCDDHAGQPIHHDSTTSLSSCFQESYEDFKKGSGTGDTVSHSNGVHDGQLYHPINSKALVDKVAKNGINSQERETAISRYKEKKKTRRYDKHIRYQSRKVRAETRTRIKGRFARPDC